MALSIKEGVLFENIHSRLIRALTDIDQIYTSLNKVGVITSARDGHHMAGSLHYEGKALDLRTYFFTPLERKDFFQQLQVRLGPDFDVVLESDHVHVEFDP